MNKENWRQVAHLSASLLILMHGFDSFEKKNFEAAAGYFGIAILVLLIACLYKFIERRFNQANVAFFLLEASTLCYSAWNYYEGGRKVLACIIAAASLFFFIYAFTIFISNDQPKKTHSRRKHSGRKRRKTMSVTGSA